MIKKNKIEKFCQILKCLILMVSIKESIQGWIGLNFEVKL